ncbi:MAG: hypothetical protein ACLQUY_20555 [Ktedonobacterales bacterium]
MHQEIPKAYVASLREGTPLTDGGERAIDTLELRLSAFHPSEYFSGRMAPILSMLVGGMVLVVEIKKPLLMRSQQVFPGLSSLKMPVSKTSSRI